MILMLSLLFPILAVTVEKASPMGEGNFRNRSAPPCANSTVGVVKMTPLSFIPYHLAGGGRQVVRGSPYEPPLVSRWAPSASAT